MKVVYLLGSLNRGGTETLMLDVFRNAERYGLDAVCIYRKGGVCEDDFQQSGVRMIELPTDKNIVQYLIRLRKELQTQKAEVVHAMQALDALYARLATLGTGMKVVQTLHGFDFDAGRVGKMINRWILSRTEMNYYVSDYQRKYYQQQYGLKAGKQAVIYNGISFDKLDQAVIPGPTLRTEFRIPEGILLMGMVGNFNAVRDQLTVCRFLKLLNMSGKDFRFIFVGKRVAGQESLYDQCVEFCDAAGLADKVIFAGVRHDVPAILKQLDLFVYSSACDTFGIAVVEALASGLPVLVNDWAVMREISNNGQLCNLYATGDENDLYVQFSQLISNLYKDNQKAVAIRQVYSIENHIQQLKQQYLFLNSSFI